MQIIIRIKIKSHKIDFKNPNPMLKEDLTIKNINLKPKNKIKRATIIKIILITIIQVF